ncbi:hypothetical protein CMPELA_08785 [Cupriavidus necator]
MLVKVASKDSETVVNALIKHVRKLPQELYKSLTWDHGKEMADHKRFTVATDIQVYFCDPRAAKPFRSASTLIRAPSRRSTRTPAKRSPTC